MKRLLAYLFIVLGFGLTFSVNLNGKEINKEFYKFKKILIPLSKDGQWKLIETKKRSVHDVDLSWKYFVQLDGNNLSKLIEVLHITGSKYSPNEVANWFKNYTFQTNGYKSCIPKSGSGQSANLREKYYVYEEVNSSVVNCFFTRNMNTDDEISNQLIKRNTSYVDTNSLANIVKDFIGNEIKLPKIMLRSDHYFYSRNGLYAYFEMINPEVNGAPKTLFTSEKENEYYPSNINAHPEKKDFYLNWIKMQAKKHLEFENKLVKNQKYKLDLAKYIGDGVINDFNKENETEKTIKVADNLQSSDLTKNQEKLNDDEINVDAKICIRKWPSSKSQEPDLALVKKSKLCPGPDGGRKYDILKFKDSKRYKDRLSAARKSTGEKDALVVMKGELHGMPVVVAAFEFAFLGGSMASVVGARFVKGVEYCLEHNIPFICFSASGGARMQEALFSLMQMAKTSAALAKMSEKGLPYVSVLTDPTMGGVSASLAMLGDINVAEPKALIGFAGPRVIEQTVRETLPEGFQKSEFLLEHGAIDMIVSRHDMRATVARLLAAMTQKPAPVIEA